jgi:hypothetical protein
LDPFYELLELRFKGGLGYGRAVALGFSQQALRSIASGGRGLYQFLFYELGGLARA